MVGATENTSETENNFIDQQKHAMQGIKQFTPVKKE